jgi:hypothetical protein
MEPAKAAAAFSLAETDEGRAGVSGLSIFSKLA